MTAINGKLDFRHQKNTLVSRVFFSAFKGECFIGVIFDLPLQEYAFLIYFDSNFLNSIVEYDLVAFQCPFFLRIAYPVHIFGYFPSGELLSNGVCH